MKKTFILLAFALFYSALVQAQITAGPGRIINTQSRNIRINYVARDSVNLALSDGFELIEDSCSQIIRYAKLNMRERKFMGIIKDVSRLDPSLIITEGNYTDGKKDGYFTTHYLNGKLQAKGAFKNNRYDGKWEMYYDDGKPKLFFEANGNDIKIMEAWDTKGNKTIDNGKGNYRSDLGDIYWKGKLLNGSPDGTWEAVKTNDGNNNTLISEKYKNGAFQKGNGPLGAYSDAPRLELVNINMLPFTHAELVRISLVNCNGEGIKLRNAMHAQYRNGPESFNQSIKDLVGPYFGKIDLHKYLNEVKFDIDGEINETGNIIKLNSNSPYAELTNGLVSLLRRLPPLIPATLNGKPVKEKITFSFTLDQGVYHFVHRMLPVEAN
ncbi:MAG TPA: hypothetical protein VL490_00375 [Mucilaginibacter sp.]|jgi:hypothetical protein|nr:hypothetical protein [Mucilaginibacter sp.]